MSKTRDVLVTGANRGIGLELCRQLIGRGDRVIASVRSADKGDQLRALGARVVEMDVSQASSISGLGAQIGESPLDLLINNAGVGSTSKSLSVLDCAEMSQVMCVNAIAPMLVVKSVIRNLRLGQGRMICQITSQLASIANNTGGSSYAYRASKAALNQLNRSLAAELKPEGFTCVAIHPGWVRTDMGGPDATLSVEQSASSILKTLDTIGPGELGRFLNYDGTTLPW